MGSKVAKRVRPDWQQAQTLESCVREAALGCGLRVSQVQAGRTSFEHWMFEDREG